MTYSVYCGNVCYVSGMTYREAELWCCDNALTDDIDDNYGYEICEDDGVVNE